MNSINGLIKIWVVMSRTPRSSVCLRISNLLVSCCWGGELDPVTWSYLTRNWMLLVLKYSRTHTSEVIDV